MVLTKKYTNYLNKLLLNKINLKKQKQKSKFYILKVFFNDKKKEVPRLFFHAYFNWLFLFNLNGCCVFLEKKLSKKNSPLQILNFFFFFDKATFRKIYWIF